MYRGGGAVFRRRNWRLECAVRVMRREDNGNGHKQDTKRVIVVSAIIGDGVLRRGGEAERRRDRQRRNNSKE
jgi:hypothetical protein